jgi:serine protease
MRGRSRLILLVGLLLAGTLIRAVAADPENNRGVARQPVANSADQGGQVIVGWRVAQPDPRVEIAAATNATARVQALSGRLGLQVQALRDLAPRMQLLQLDETPGAGTHAEQLRRLRADAEIEFVEPNYRRYRHAVPDDPLYSTTVNNIVGQWYFRTPPSPPVPPSGASTSDINAAIDSEHAWDITTGSAGTVVAVLDTGVRYDHPDLTARLLPNDPANGIVGGYDFVSGESTTNFLVANDGNGWDPDPSDPGDWIDSTDLTHPVFAGCSSSTSSWHGTRVTGLLGAATNNAAGIAGGTWQPMILPVRVLGKCFGTDADIIAGMRWAAGIHVTGVPDNPHPARILNLSLGAVGSCPASYSPVISEVTALGVLVVVSAGNASGPVDSPGNCPGVLAIGGLRHAGTKVGYSSFGAQIGVSAPAGNCVNVGAGPCLYALTTTINLGTTTPGASGYATQNDATPNVGTSFSAPLVSGIAALMQGVNSHLNTSQMIARIKEGAVAFPADSTLPNCPAVDSSGQCNCTTTTCGAGMANALNSVNAALRPIANVAPPAPSAGQNVMLDGSASVAADGHIIATYAWTAVTGGASPPGIGANSPIATVVAPAAGVATYQRAITSRLTVTDNQVPALQDHADVTATVTVPRVTVSFTAAPPAISTTGTSTLTWNTVNATSCIASGAWTGGQPISGTLVVGPFPAGVRTYSLSCTDGLTTDVKTATVTITVPGSGGGGSEGLPELLILLCAARAWRRRKLGN